MRWVLIPALSVLLLAGACKSTTASEKKPNPEIEKFLTSYFATWSRGDIDAYGAHFSPKATITLIEKGSVQWVLPLDRFLATQRHAVKSEKMVERMTSFVADVDDVAASATVQWVLEKKNKKSTGVDRFILFKDFNGEWLIQSLVFYGD